MKKFLIASLAVFLLLLTSCGGGSGGQPVTDVQPDPVDPPEPVSRTTGIIWSSVTLEPVDRVVKVLKLHASGGPWDKGTEYETKHSPGLVRYTTRPTVRFAAGMTERERAISKRFRL